MQAGYCSQLKLLAGFYFLEKDGFLDEVIVCINVAHDLDHPWSGSILSLFINVVEFCFLLFIIKLIFTGPTKKMNFFSALTDAMDISLKTDPTTLIFGKLAVTGRTVIWNNRITVKEILLHQYLHWNRKPKKTS